MGWTKGPTSQNQKSVVVVYGAELKSDGMNVDAPFFPPKRLIPSGPIARNKVDTQCGENYAQSKRRIKAENHARRRGTCGAVQARGSGSSQQWHRRGSGSESRRCNARGRPE